MTRQTKANFISVLLHGVLVAAFLAQPRLQSTRSPAMVLDLCLMEPQMAVAFAPVPTVAPPEEPQPAAAIPAPPPPMPEEKPLPLPVPPPVLVKPEKAKPPARPVAKKVKLSQPALAEEQPIVETASRSAPVQAAASAPVQENDTPAASAGRTATASPGHAAQGDSPSSLQAASGPLRDAAFGEGSAPSFTRRVLPEYPRQARRLGRQGKVVLRLSINEKGILEAVEVVESGGTLFDEASINAAKASSYRPAMVNGIRIASSALLPVRFQLDTGQEER